MTAQMTAYGRELRRLRLEAGLSMGQVARAIGVSVVHYSRVENGKENPFPPGRTVDYRVLAKILRTSATELQTLAASERRIELDLKDQRQDVREFAVELARRIEDDSLTPEQVHRLKSILDGSPKRGKSGD